jgi:predicted small lipoprotein YifL
MRRALLALCAVLSLVGVAACGDKNSQRANDYVTAVNRAQNDFAATFNKLQAQITPKSSPKQDRATLGKFEKAIDRVVAQLRAVQAPANVKTLHAQLVAAIASYRDAVEKARRAFATKDRDKLVKAQASLVRSVTRISARITRTINQINDKLHE